MSNSNEQLDAEVNEYAEEEDWPMTTELPRFLYPVLLSLIVRSSPTLLDPQYKDNVAAKALLKSNPELGEELRKAWTTKSYQRIREHELLRLTSGQRDVAQAIKAAWRIDYSGEAHKLLLKTINAMDRTHPHTNYVAIVQSSGTGKSRMVDELAKEVFTLPFNLRKNEGLFPYPQPDERIRSLLTQSFESAAIVEIRFFLFFKHLFSAAADAFSSQRKTCSGKQQTKEEIASSWWNYLLDHRSELYDRVFECWEKDLSNIPDEEETMKSAKDNLQSLIQLLDGESVSSADARSIKVIMYFDEAHELNVKVHKEDPKRPRSLFDIFTSVLSHFCHLPVICIFLSTYSSLDMLAPPTVQVISERARANHQILQPPITETPYDCFDINIVPGKLQLKDLSKIGFLAKWGRCLWWSFYIGAGARDQVRDQLIDTARMKLLCTQDIDGAYTTFSLTALTAVFDVMLKLDYQPLHALSHQEQVKMVASHMRIAYSVPKHRTFFQSGYPSEPLLAEAAVQQAHKFQTQADAESRGVNVMLMTLCKSLNNRLIDLGQRGELVMRCLLTQAYMHAVVEEGHDLFSHGCSLLTFITHLFAEKYATEILDSRPDNIKSQKRFREQFQNAVVRFTHFVKAVDDTAPSTHAIFAAFIRGMAFICHDQQKDVDLVIPVLLNKDAALRESDMSAMLIQVKRHTTASGPSIFAFDQKGVGLFHFATSDDKRPYITIIAELGVKPNANAATQTKALVLRSLSKSPAVPQKKHKPGPARPSESPQSPSKLRVSPQPEVLRHPKDLHPRYSLTAYGCSSTVYNVIKPTEKDEYQHLLGTTSLLGEHGRQDTGSLSAVRRLKPFWNIGKDCYHWIEDPILQNSVPAGGDTDGALVLVGEYGEEDDEVSDE